MHFFEKTMCQIYFEKILINLCIRSENLPECPLSVRHWTGYYGYEVEEGTVLPFKSLQTSRVFQDPV